MNPEFQSPIGLRIDPLDVLFFREGRPFEAANRVESRLPNPQTFAGAMRTALLAQANFNFSALTQVRRKNARSLADRKTLVKQLRDDLRNCDAPEWILDTHFRGPWIAIFSPIGKEVEPILPFPLHIAKGEKTDWVRAKPHRAEFPGWPEKEFKPLLWNGEKKAKQKSSWVTLSGMKQLLHPNRTPDPFELFADKELHEHDNRIGIAVDQDTFTSADGQLYGIRFLSLKDRVDRKEGKKYDGWKVGFYAEMILPANHEPPKGPWLVPFGGEGKYVNVSTLSPCEWPKKTDDTNYWVLASGCFFDGEGPYGKVMPSNPKPTAAMTGHPIALSGWDIARNGPHPIRFGVPAGSVYFFSRDQKIDLKHQSFAEDSEDRQQGWGFALPGQYA